jgi:hypothetical protein
VGGLNFGQPGAAGDPADEVQDVAGSERFGLFRVVVIGILADLNQR